MDFSVAICTWNRADMLRQTLDSLCRMEVPPEHEWEVLVVDNNSSDCTPETIASFQDKLPLVHLTEQKPGQSYARNQAFERSRGEFIIFTDDDVLVDEGWATGVLDAFRKFDADLVYGRSVPWWETKQPDWFSEKFMGRFALLDHGDEPMIVSDPTKRGYGLNHAFRRSALRRVGGYRTDMGLRHGKGAGGEDSEIFGRAHDFGLRVAYTPKAVVRHFIPASRCDKSFSRTRAWRGSEDYLNFVRSNAKSAPSLFGVPRYVYRQNMAFCGNYLVSLAARRKSDAYHYELKVLRFIGMLYWLMKTGRRPPGESEDAE